MPAANRIRDYAHHDPVAVHAARELGMKPGSVEQLLRGRGRVDVRTAALIRSFIATQEFARMSGFYSPIELAATQIPVPALEDNVFITAQTADLDEDEVEILYHLKPNRARARGWVTAIDRERSAQLIVREALVQHWELR